MHTTSDTPDTPRTPETPATIGRRIAAARKALGLTQQALADEVGVSFQAVSKWETDGSLPDVLLIAPIAEALGLGVDELLTGRRPAAAEGADVAGGDSAPEAPRASWGRIMGTVTKPIHGDVDSIMGVVTADIHGDVRGDITGEVQSIHGNVLGNILGEVHGDIDGYVKGKLLGIVHGRVKGGVRGKVLGPIIGDGINVEQTPAERQKSRGRRG